MNRSTKFINDIFIYAIGNLGSKLITFLLVPLYTYYISPDDFGYYDIVLTLTFLAMGFITFQLRDGTFRFLLDNEDEYTRKGVVSFSYKLMAQSSLVVLLVGIVFSFFYDIRDWGWIVAFVITLSLYEVEVQIVRGLGQNKSFVLAGILTAFQIGLYSLIFVAWLRMGIAGIFCSNILSRLVTMVIIEFRARVFKRYFIVSFRDKSLNRALLKYSLPLLPNAVCWWLLGSVPVRPCGRRSPRRRPRGGSSGRGCRSRSHRPCGRRRSLRPRRLPARRGRSKAPRFRPRNARR